MIQSNWRNAFRLYQRSGIQLDALVANKTCLISGVPFAHKLTPGKLCLRPISVCALRSNLPQPTFLASSSQIVNDEWSRDFSSTRRCDGGIDSDFQEAQQRLSLLSDDPGNVVKLQIYGLFKQSTVGKCNTKKPGMTDFVGKAKWSAWNDLGDITQDEAKKKYIQLIDSLVKDQAPVTTAQEGIYKELLVKKENGVMTITKNRPTKKNALNFIMYEELGQALQEGAEDNSVTLAVVTGSGDYYCSGNDLGNFMNIAPDQMAEFARKGGDILEKFVNAYIDFPKPLIGVINGPAVGVAVTLLGLFDAVYATESATFNTPFSALGQSPEGCSSDLFPKILGPLKANEMLLFNAKLTATEACNLGLVTQVYPDAKFQDVWEKINGMAKLPKGSLRYSKELIRPLSERQRLKAVNRMECDRLIERWQSSECVDAIMKFFSK